MDIEDVQLKFEQMAERGDSEQATDSNEISELHGNVKLFVSDQVDPIILSARKL